MSVTRPPWSANSSRPASAVSISPTSPCRRANAFRPWHDKATGRTGVKVTGGKCPHYYFYFPRERLGLVYVRVPTWLPFRLRVCFNGHGWLAGQLRAAGVAFRLEDNAFVEIADWARAQAMEEGFSIAALQEDLDGLARQCVPALAPFRSGYRWSLMQVAALKLKEHVLLPALARG